ncbi:ABC transporter substrate-binding protein [Flexivirga sp.]|uniref:ABC transporter substrate-binding protein n=1 Tax=Flexivirga sp. TaxID=1962927 RepID=UPI002D7F6793|nr:ABC transporter substrate-binding protein [Flexivirga sp.]
MMRRSSKIAAAVVMIAMPLAACSSSGPSSSNTSSKGSSTPRAKVKSSAMDASVKGPAPDIAGAKKGGTLTITDAGAPPTFDPAGAYYEFSMTILSELVTRGLTGYQIDQDGKSTLVPDMAQGLGKESADGKTWTFKLKPGMKYSNGQPVKAADFVYAIKRSFDENLGGQGPVPYLKTTLVGGDTYKGPFTDKGKDFKGVTSKGDDTVIFHLTRKWPTLPYYLAFPAASPVPQSAEKKSTYEKSPLATGPYKFKTFNKGTRIVLEKNTQWDAKSDPIRHQYPDTIDVKLGVTALTEQQRIFANSGPGATTLDISGLDAGLESKAKSQTKQVVFGPSPCESYLPLNSKEIPLEVRKAIAVAYPYDQTRKAGGESKLTFDPATTYAPPQVPGIKQYPAVNGLIGKGSGDPAKAKAMLKKAGKSNFELSWYYVSGKGQDEAANDALKSAMQKAGFKVKDVPVSQAEISEKINDPNAPENVGQGISSWCYDWPSGDSIYPQLFSTTTAKDGRSVANLQDTAIDKELDRISALDPTQAAPEWLAFDKKMTKQVMGIPLSYSKASSVLGNKVHNVVPDPNHGLPDFAQVWVG